MAMLVFEFNDQQKIDFINWYKDGNDPVLFNIKPAYFYPECIENIRHEVPEGCSYSVFTKDSKAICGFVANDSLINYSLYVSDNYKWIDKVNDHA